MPDNRDPFVFPQRASTSYRTRSPKEPIIISGTSSGLSIVEAPIRIFGDAGNIYIDDVGGRTELELSVRELGGPLRRDVQITVATDKSGTLLNPEFLVFPGTLVRQFPEIPTG